MRKRELESMSIIELIDGMIWDPSNCDPYRKRLIYLLAQAKSNSVGVFMPDELEVEPQLQLQSPLDYTSLIVGRKSNSGWVPLVQAMRTSKWDRKDHRTRGAVMQKTPDEVEEFMGDSITENFSYEIMTPGQCALADTITHAFSAWLRMQPVERRNQ